jgi:uncharacterized protein (TIRG00374 family)
LKKFLVTLLKIGISAAIIAYLVWDATKTEKPGEPNVFQQLVDQPKQWDLLVAAWVCCAGAVLITLVRWWYLVRALEIRLSLNDSLRIGFMGYLFNLAPLGIVAGDVLKAVMLAQRQRERRAQAFATVAVDRVIGLYMLFVVASVAVLLTGFFHHAVATVRYISLGTLAATAVATAGMVALFIPGLTGGRLTRMLSNLRHVGPPVEHLVEAMRMYRRKVHVLIVSALMSVGVHTLFTLGMYLITIGLYEEVHNLSLRAEFIVSPLSAATGIIPLVMGPFEAVLTYLYEEVFAMSGGLVVALGYRLICILIAMVGVCYYLGSRSEVTQVLQTAEQEQPAEQPSSGPTT